MPNDSLHPGPDREARALAEAAGAAMFERDPASRGLGMTLDEIGPGFARM
jgi:acyl-CoA thioesterase